jgi:hypothetical protein
MSKWMSIGFDPDQMDSAAEPNAQAAMGEAHGEVAQRQSGGLDHATHSELGAVSDLNGSTTHWIAGALKHLVARRRTPAATEWTR